MGFRGGNSNLNLNKRSKKGKINRASVKGRANKPSNNRSSGRGSKGKR